MKNDIKETVIELSTLLEKKAIDYIIKNAIDDDDGIGAGDLMAILISSHMSSLFTCMSVMTRHDKEMHKNTRELIKNIEDAIGGMDFIEKVEDGNT